LLQVQRRIAYAGNASFMPLMLVPDSNAGTVTLRGSSLHESIWLR
jgi:hypothetical protein